MLDVNNKSTRYEVDSTKHSKSQVCVPRGNIFIFMLYVHACVHIETHVAEKSRGRVSCVLDIGSLHCIVLSARACTMETKEGRKGREGNEGRT